MRKKKVSLTIMLFLSICSFAYSQTQTTDKVPKDSLEFDFMDFAKSQKTLDSYKLIKNGNKFKLKITNINKTLWNISDSTRQQSFNTEMPAIFSGIKLPGYLNLSVPSPSNGIIPAGDSPGYEGPTFNDINAWLNTISNAKKVLNNTNDLNNEFKNLYANCADKYAVIDATKLELVKNFLPTGESTRATQIQAIKKYLRAQVTASVESLDKLKGGIPIYLAEQQNKINSATEGIIWEWKNNPPPKTPIQPYIIAGKGAQKAENKNEAIKAHMEAIKASLTKATETVDEIKKFLDDNKIEELITNYSLINESNWVYYTNEMKVKQDEVNIDLAITAIKPLTCDMPAKRKIQTDYQTYGGLKVDFSTGVFVMFGNDDFVGRDLYYKPVDSVTTMIKSKDGGNRLLLGIGGLMHIYWRSQSTVNWAISPGLSTTTAFEGLNFHLGGSLIVGGKNRIVFTVGAVFREAKVLDKEFELDKNYAKAKLPEAVPTIKVFPKFGGFFSLTYNWSKLKKQ